MHFDLIRQKRDELNKDRMANNLREMYKGKEDEPTYVNVQM